MPGPYNSGSVKDLRWGYDHVYPNERAPETPATDNVKPEDLSWRDIKWSYDEIDLGSRNSEVQEIEREENQNYREDKNKTPKEKRIQENEVLPAEEMSINSQARAAFEKKNSTKADFSEDTSGSNMTNNGGFIAWYNTYLAKNDGATEISDVLMDNKGDDRSSATDADDLNDESEIISVSNNQLKNKTYEKIFKEDEDHTSQYLSIIEERSTTSIVDINLKKKFSNAKDASDLDSIEENVSHNVDEEENGPDLDSVEEEEETKYNILHPIYRWNDSEEGFKRQVVDRVVLQ